MPSYPPPRRYRSDNIGRVLPRERANKLRTVLGILRSRSGPWLERDPDELESWWQDVLRDPRAQRTRMENIPADHPDARLRLDRYDALAVTVTCANCRASAVYTMDDLRSSFSPSLNVTRLPAFLLPCGSKRDRRDGACRLTVEESGTLENLRTVERAKREVS
jgi:hypothetical protein